MGNAIFIPGFQLNEVVEFIDRYVQAEKSSLISEYPNISELKESGSLMGEEGFDHNQNNKEMYNKERLNLIKKMMPKIQASSKFLITKTINRVNLGKKIKFFAELITLTSSTSLIGTIIAKEELASQILSVATFVSAAANRAVEYILDLNNPHLANAKDILDEIIQNDVNLLNIEEEIELALRYNINDRIEILLVQSHKSFEFINRVLLSMHGTKYEEQLKMVIARA